MSKAATVVRTLMVLILVAGVLACGGKKRPPAINTDPRTDPRATATPYPEPVNDPAAADLGPDVLPMPTDSTTGVDYSADTESPGGPLTDIQFGYDSAALTDEARAVLEKHALWLQNRRDVKVTIEGHCDERGTVDYNLALGDQRARTTRDYLLNLGVSADRLNAISLGKERPLDPANTEAAFARNRRAHFVIVR